MKKYLLGICAVVLAIAFTAFSSFKENTKKSNYDITVRYLQGSSWSSTNELLPDAQTSSGCPEGAAAICAEFYDINHLNFSGSTVTGIKNMPGSSDPYPPDAVLRYVQ